MIRYAPWLFLMLSLFSCFRKKSPPKSIEPWLEQQFPGRFSVLNSNLKMLDVMAQFRGEKRALVADKADADVQFFLDWEKGVESLGLDTQTVADAHTRAKTDVAAAREWFGRLQQAGLEKFSAGVVDESLTVQVFREPTAPERQQALDRVQVATAGQAPGVVFVEMLEPAAFGTEYRNIIPRGHWETGTGWQRRNMILSLRIEPGAETPAVWKYNPESTRCGQYQNDAFEQARMWADKNLPKPFFMDSNQMAACDLKPQTPKGKGPAIGFSFPYFDKQPTGESDNEPQGYVYGVYYPEEQIFTEIRKQREF
ncbi:MAG: hypothetical protein JNJ90_04835 [Saprospiraceae bacterium]|jgi:hypothetical protein|nr:hypothetical protein [Saprospiraceae bacterium]